MYNMCLFYIYVYINQKKDIFQNMVIILGKKQLCLGFPDGPVVKNLPANAGDMDLIPAPGRSHMLQSS